MDAPTGLRVVDQEVRGLERRDFDLAGGVVDRGIAEETTVENIVNGARCALDVVEQALRQEGAEVSEIEFE